MPKGLLRLVLALMLTFSLAACGGGEDDDEGDEGDAPAGLIGGEENEEDNEGESDGD